MRCDVLLRNVKQMSTVKIFVFGGDKHVMTTMRHLLQTMPYVLFVYVLQLRFNPKYAAQRFSFTSLRAQPHVTASVDCDLL